jgi:hypothetical protein
VLSSAGCGSNRAESPTLRARVREPAREAEIGLAALIASKQGLAEDELWPRVQASAAVSVFRTVYGHGVARMLAGADPELVAADYLRELRRGFDALELGFAGSMDPLPSDPLPSDPRAV